MKKAYKMKNGAPYVIMVLPALLVFVTFFILPLIFTAKYSFYSWTNFSQEITFNGLENYRKIFDDPILAKGIKNTLIFAFVTVTVQSLISLPVSVFLNSKIKGSNIYRAIYFAPAVLSTLVVGYLWKYLMSSSDYGFINQVLTGMGFEKVNFLGNAQIALFAIITISVWQWFGWSMVIYLGSLQSISEELYEAASVDGANGLQKFWHITIPGLAPAIKINFVTSTISGLKIFDLILATTNGGPAHQTETILSLMFSKFSDGNYGYASAFGMVFLLVSMLVAAVMLGVFKKWEDRLG
ncbi:sugar ABC transporter permease [Muricomes sp. OA1]|uniref:Sugar ABC transporter permease n=1 Tax=Hungatella hathewayi TaxID=154046 RepID=A0A3E2WMD9_9FIRM|nr:MULTISPECIES: sugar ABC transporter permease [Clostridia]MCH1971935.1 sugar ABC transporter permease [Muricomes sp. OA1]MEE0201737.1 sugar ABC transporter permease [Muricomes sp.]RGC27804.1 sugar ABC transporter permease [Hungatella hathewayi]GKH30735.1 ABC transporter permease [Faecalicatena contorta]